MVLLHWLSELNLLTEKIKYPRLLIEDYCSNEKRSLHHQDGHPPNLSYAATFICFEILKQLVPDYALLIFLYHSSLIDKF